MSTSQKTVVHPPKAGMAVHIGVTGHRNLAGSDPQRLEEQISDVLRCVRDAAQGLAEQLTAYYSGDGPALRLLSMLAEGSDQIAARRALELGYRLQCPLPMRLEPYEETFSTAEGRAGLGRLLERAESVLEIGCCSDIPERAFQNCGYVMLGHVDILLAVWNGRDSGKVGGTYDIMEQAKRMGIPVLCVDSMAPHAIRFVDGAPDGADWREGVQALLRGLLSPAGVGNNSPDAFPRAYFEENLADKRRQGLYRAFVSLISGRKPGKVPGGGEPEPTGMQAHYRSADALADRYGDAYRSAGVLRQLLPFAASIGLAVGFYASLLEGPVGASPAVKQILGALAVAGFALQAVCFAAIIALSRIEKAKRWQRKFIDYRMLSELLRLYGHVRPSGLVIRGLSVPAYMSNVNVSWVNWHFRAIVREAGLPNITLTAEELTRRTTDIKDGLLQSQIRYHGNNAGKMARIASRLEKFGIGVYYAGVAVTVLRAAVFALGTGKSIPLDEAGRQYLSKMFNMLSLVVPLFSSLAFGLSAQEGFDRIRTRSEAMLGRLELMAGQIDRLGTLDYNAFMKLSEQVSELILSEFTDWNALIRTKPISDH